MMKKVLTHLTVGLLALTVVFLHSTRAFATGEFVDPEDSVSWTEDSNAPDTSEPDTSEPDTSDPDTSDPEDSVSWEDALSMAGTQVAELSEGNYALRFGFNLNCAGVTSDEEYNTVIADDATVTIDGTAYPLQGFGARVSLYKKVPMTVPAGKLYSVNGDGTVTYTARIIDIDENNLNTAIFVSGYVTYLDGDVVKTYETKIYSDTCHDASMAANLPSAE